MKRLRPAGMTREQWAHLRYLNQKAAFRDRSLKYYAANRNLCLQQCMVRDAQTKLDVLSHYGKDGKLNCCWPDCTVIDPDMLSLDHLNNDGAADRREGKAGIKHYRLLRKTEYPEGFQTLCHNHQWKKELMRRRGE